MSSLPFYHRRDCPLVLLRLYYLYLFLALEAISLSCLIHFSYLDHKTPMESFLEFVSDVLRNYDWTIFFACALVLAILLLNLQLDEKEQYTPNSFCSKRCIMAAGMICINMLLTGNSIFSLYCSWAKEIINRLIISITFCLVYIYIKIGRELDSPIHYRLSKTTKISNPQKLAIIFFLAVFGASSIWLSFINLDQFTDEYVGFAFYYTTRYFCPAINIFAIPMIYVAFLAYNSEEFAFSGKEPTSGRFWYGVCRWNEKLGEWEHVETIPEKTESLVLDV